MHPNVKLTPKKINSAINNSSKPSLLKRESLDASIEDAHNAEVADDLTTQAPPAFLEVQDVINRKLEYL